MPDEADSICELCERSFLRKQLTKHHCLPRSEGGDEDDIALLCGSCHSMVHHTFTNETLAILFPTAVRLQEAPELQGYLKWIRKQPTTSRKRHKRRRNRL